MALEVHALQGGMGRRLKWHGAVSGKEVIARNDHALRTKGYEGLRWLIIDYSAATSMDISVEEIQTIKEQDDRFAAVLPELVTAVVVPHEVGFGLTRMWEMLTERPGWSTHAFRSMAKAEAWLREEVRHKFKLELPEDLSTR